MIGKVLWRGSHVNLSGKKLVVVSWKAITIYNSKLKDFLRDYPDSVERVVHRGPMCDLHFKPTVELNDDGRFDVGSYDGLPLWKRLSLATSLDVNDMTPNWIMDACFADDKTADPRHVFTVRNELMFQIFLLVCVTSLLYRDCFLI